MKRALFSIIIPTLNEEKFLPRLLESLTRQSSKNFEVIVVDGSSRDKTVMLARQYLAKLPRLQVISVKKPSLPLQRNIGARAAKGDWFVFVDADSIFLPYFIERITVFIGAKKPRLFTTWFRSDTDDPKDGVYTLIGNAYLEATLIVKKPLTPGPLTIVTREAFNEVGGYDEAHAYNEDVDFGLRLYKAGIHLDMLRETLCVLSLRRFRKEGTLKVLNQYLVSLFPILLFNRPMKHMPGYIMGGQLYGKKQTLRKPVRKGYELKMRTFLRELFA